MNTSIRKRSVLPTVIFALMLSAVMAPASVSAQKDRVKAKKEKPAQPHRIVFQLTTADSLSHKGLMRQLNNVLNEAPDAKLEVVCHGPGLDMLVSGKTVVEGKINELAAKGVVFLACENTLKERKIERGSVLPAAGYVKAGIIHIVQRQEQGWSYIKAGM